MLYRSLADLAMIVHFAFIVFIAIGGLLSWRWPRLIWLHVPAVVWGIAIITVGFSCPLTPLEKYLRGLAGEEGYEGGFVDRYLEDVIYPGELTPLLRVLAAVAVVAGYAALLARRQRRPAGRQGTAMIGVPHPTAPAATSFLAEREVADVRVGADRAALRVDEDVEQVEGGCPAPREACRSPSR